MFKHIKKLANFRNFVIYFLVHGVIMIAVLFSIIRLMLPQVEKHLPEIERVASESFGVDIQVDKLDTGWRGLGPVLRFEGVTMLNAQTQQPLAQVHYFDIELDIFASLRHWKLIPGRLTLDGINFILEQEEDGGFRLKNHLSSDERSMEETLSSLLTSFKRLVVKHGSVEVDMKEGNPVYLHLDYMSFYPKDEQYRFEAELTGAQLPAHIKVIADIEGQLENLGQASVDGYLQMAQVSYDARFMPLKFYAIKPQSGNLDLDAWFRWEEGHWQELIGKIQLHNVMLQNAIHPEVILPFSVNAHIAWQHMGGDYWRLSGDNIVLNVGNLQSPESSFMLEGSSFEPWNFRLNAVSMDDVIDILSLSDQIDNKTRQALHALNIKGELHDLQWIAQPTESGFKDWRVGIKLDNLHWQAYQSIPAANNLSGELRLTEHQGQLSIDSENFNLNLPDFFEAPLNFDAVRGVVTWVNNNEWLIHTDQLTFVTPETDLDAVFTLKIPADFNLATIDLIATTGEFNQVVAKKYLPTRYLPTNLVSWINQSVQTARVSSMKTIIKGPLKNFPFKNGEGEYSMTFDMDEVDLQFHPEWPVLHHLSGQLILGAKGLEALINSGSVFGSALTQSKVDMTYTKAPEPLILKIQGEIQGSAHDAETFLRASPLWAKLGQVFDMIEIRGPLKLAIDTNIPLRGSADLFKIKGDASIEEGTVNIKSWKLNLEEVKGALQFTENSITSKGIQGNFLNKPGVLTASTVTKNNQSEITWNYHSTLNKAMIQNFAKSQLWNYIEGESEYDASFKAYIPKRADPFAVTIQSSLKGVSMNLPRPLLKTADQVLPSSVSFSFPDPNLMRTDFQFGEALNGKLNFLKSKTGYELTQGLISGGAAQSNLPLPDAGLVFTGQFKNLIIQDWTNFFEQHNKQYPPAPGAQPLNFVITDLRAEDLQYKDWHLSRARLNADKGVDYWNIDLNSDQLEGLIKLPHRPEFNPFVFNFARCAWPLGQDKSKTSDLKPRDIYAMNLQCKQFKYKNNDIGHLTLGVIPKRETDSILFEPIRLESATDKLTARGEWVPGHGSYVSHFKGDAVSENMGVSLKGWGVPTDVQDAKGDGKFDLKWVGSPRDFSAKTLTGELDLRMQNGRFVGVNPGFGRMLGLLSFQGLQRRLRLDFSDVFKSGFAFDTFKVNLAIKDGVARTNNGALKAPAADINFTGETNLVSHALNFDMIVNAHIDSTVPAAAVAIANPAAGAAVWIVDKVFNPLGNVTKYRYHVTGTWDQPEFADKTEEYRKELDGPAKVKEAS